MEGAILTLVLIGALVGSAVGGLILWGLAKGVGKIENANYGNSFLICLVSSIAYNGIWFIIGFPVLMELGLAGILVANIVLLSILYVSFGKVFWKCEWIQSVKANAVWIIAFSLLNAVMFG
jgi:hypothetical protein